jgi:hypothetical protein
MERDFDIHQWQAKFLKKNKITQLNEVIAKLVQGRVYANKDGKHTYIGEIPSGQSLQGFKNSTQETLYLFADESGKKGLAFTKKQLEQARMDPMSTAGDFNKSKDDDFILFPLDVNPRNTGGDFEKSKDDDFILFPLDVRRRTIDTPGGRWREKLNEERLQRIDGMIHRGLLKDFLEAFDEIHSDLILTGEEFPAIDLIEFLSQEMQRYAEDTGMDRE